MLLVMKTGVDVRAAPMRDDGTGEMAEEEKMECCGATDVLASRQVGNKQGLQEQNHKK